MKNTDVRVKNSLVTLMTFSEVTFIQLQITALLFLPKFWTPPF